VALALWKRYEALAEACQRRLNGARASLDADAEHTQ
jgi:exonuclease VII small subunit